jgi:ADP-ribose pyrophosphatase
MNAKVNEKKLLHEGRTFLFVRENVTLPNSATVDLDIVRHPGAAAVVPLLTEGKLLMLKQYRHAVGRYIWEIPAGTLNVDEPAISCAKRELIEETGYSSDRLTTLGTVTPVPGYSDELIYLFLARDLVPSQQNLDHDEVLDVHEIFFNEAFTMIRNGAVQDAKTICALFLARDHLRKTDPGSY